MRCSAGLFMAGVSILIVHHTGYSDSNISKNTSGKSGGTQLRSLSIKSVIDCKSPAPHWQGSKEAASNVKNFSEAEVDSFSSEPVPLISVATFLEDLEEYERMKQLFSPPAEQVTTKTEAYLAIADELNLKFIGKTYRRFKSGEERVTARIERSIRSTSNFDVKLKADPFKLKIASTITLNAFQKVYLSADSNHFSADYRFEIPIDDLDRWL